MAIFSAAPAVLDWRAAQTDLNPMNYLIGAIGGVLIVLAVLYFVLRAPTPRYRRSDQETDWDEHTNYPGDRLRRSDDWHDAHGEE